MSEQFEITREIGIDMGHRVTYHGSKCRNLHGHRYTVYATCVGQLFASGEQEGMVLDFGFLKEEMMEQIDAPCDHGMCIWWQDPLLPDLIGTLDYALLKGVDRTRAALVKGKIGKMYIVPFVPTAENLAKHWFELLAPRVIDRTQGQAKLKKVLVYETPNCSASYPTGV